VHRWATGIVGTPQTEPWQAELDEVVGSWPDDSDLIAWFDEGADAGVTRHHHELALARGHHSAGQPLLPRLRTTLTVKHAPGAAIVVLWVRPPRDKILLRLSPDWHSHPLDRMTGRPCPGTLTDRSPPRETQRPVARVDVAASVIVAAIAVVAGIFVVFRHRHVGRD
jgi:hypothetical protein